MAKRSLRYDSWLKDMSSGRGADEQGRNLLIHSTEIIEQVYEAYWCLWRTTCNIHKLVCVRV
jgi:hypothetical protein